MGMVVHGDITGGVHLTRKQAAERKRKRSMASKSILRPQQPEKSPTPPFKGDTMQSARRKACDLCHTKKIKCDGLRPKCSSCAMYGAECKTTYIPRTATASKERSSISSPASSASPGQKETQEALESRLARIESQLQQVLSIDAASKERLGSAASGSPDQYTRSISPSEHQMPSSLGPSAMPHWAWTITPTQQGSYEQLPQEGLTIPPLDDVAPVIDHFFSNFNTITPLFCQASFMVMLSDYYNNPLGRNQATWAAIQIALAIGYRLPHGDGMPVPVESVQRSNAHLSSAQSAMSFLVTREDDMLGVQVLLGMVLLFLNCSDFKPAAVIIGNAVRLAYQLGLHEAESPKHGPPVEAEQRVRVFWIAYCLDRALSLRMKTPPAIMDDDIDVPLPVAEPRDGAGLMWIAGGSNHFNFLRCIIDLAHIEGKIFELLHSIRGAKVRGPERTQRVQHLRGLLKGWYNRIPPLFHIENLMSTVGSCGAIRLTRMYHEYQLAVLNLHSVYNTQDPEWVAQLSTASPVEESDFSVKFQQLLSPCRWDYPPPSREGWEECVAVSRACMKLFHDAFPTENIVWRCVCPLFAGTLVLLTNLLLYPDSPLATLDQHMCNKSMTVFHWAEPYAGPADRTALKSATLELVRKAFEVVDASRSGANASVPGVETLGSQQAILDTFHGGLVPAISAHQSFDMGIIPTHAALFDGTSREVGFGVGLNDFNGEDMSGLAVPTTEPLTNTPDFMRYTGR